MFEKLKLPNFNTYSKIFIFIIASFFMLPVGLVSLGVGAADAKVIVKERTKYYQVSGKTGRQVHAKFGRRGPKWMQRLHGIAGTHRVFDFKKFSVKKKGNKCVLSDVDIHLTLTYYYPRWTNKKRASKNLQNSWNKFSRELVRHEKTHGKYFKDTVRSFEKELLRTTGKISNGCRSMLRAAKRKLERAYRWGEARHKAFDRREQLPNSKVRRLEIAFIKAG